jgi:allophanate hydrolase subunit 2
MAQAVFKIVQVGPLVTYQDAGRFNLMRFGVPASGPMDRQAFAIAQAALGNDSGAGQ